MRVPTQPVGNKKGVRPWPCPLQNRLSWGHFTRFWGQNNYPQWSGTRPAPLVYGLGCVVLAWASPLCPSLVGASTTGGITGHLSYPVVRRCSRVLSWPLPNHAGGSAARSRAVGGRLPGDRVVGADDRRLATGKRP